MAPTIGRRWPKSAPRGDYAAVCQVCQVRYRRSQLVRRADGLLVCSGPGTNNDAAGRDSVTLDRLNAAHARNIGRARRAHQGGHLDQLPPLLVQSLIVPPIAFYSCGERVSSTYTDSLLQVALWDTGVEGFPLTDARTDIGYTEGTNIVATDEELTACGSTAGFCTTLYDQVGSYDLVGAGVNSGFYPQVWRQTYRQYIGVGATPLMHFGGQASLSRTDACGLSGDSALTLFVLASGTGTAVALGGTATLTGMGVAFNDEDSGDAFGTVVVDFQGHTVRYRTTRWQTLPPRQTELHAVVVRRTVGARLGQTQVRLDGADLVAETPAPDTLSLPQLTNTALCLGATVAGGDVLTGHVYALGVWNSVLSDADVLAVEAWARKAIARTADTRGILVGSVQP